MNDFNKYIINTRRYLHMHPEIGFNTHNTAKFIFNELVNMGYNPKYVVNNAGVIAKLDLGKSKTIAFRTDMDALNIKEVNDLPFKSTNDYMHACGHDGHMSIILGLAKMIMNEKENLNYNVCLIFQPAEEGPLPGGATKILEENVLENIDAFFAYHVSNKYRTGDVAIKVGPAAAAPDLFDIIVHGIGCHASTPSMGINPNIVSSHLVLELDKLYKKLLTVNPFLVITTTTISSNGAYNIIPDSLLIKGTARSFTNEERNMLKSEMQNVINSISNVYNVKIDFNFHYAYDPVINDEELTNIYFKHAKKHMNNCITLEKPEMIGEDFSYYRKLAPICLVWLGTRENDNEVIDLHSPKFSIDEKSLFNASLVLLDIIKGTDL